MRGPTRREAGGLGWRLTSRGLYVPAEVDGSQPEQRIVEAAAVLSEGGGVVGWAMLRWVGGVWFDGGSAGHAPRPVMLVARHDFVAQRGFEVTHERFVPSELEVVDGLPVLNALASVGFEARYAGSVRAATRALDMAAYNDLVSREELAAYAATLNGWTGIPQFRAALGRMRENSWSPQETDLREVCELEAGFSRLLCNQPVFDASGHHLVTPDLFDAEAGLAIEYEGEVHLESGQRRRDRDRAELMRQIGIEMVSIMCGDSADRDALVRRLLAARSRARQRTGARAWTVDQPAWWVPTETVAQRRALTPEQRERWLRLRRRTA